MITLKMGTGDEELRDFNKDWWGPTQKEWAPALLEANRAYWPGQTDPTTNRPWAPRKDKRNTKRILLGTGRMFGTSAITQEGTGFSAGPEIPGKFHQFGTSRMVARPWLGVPKESVDKLQGISWKYISK